METYKKLPKKFKAKWIAALRSGEYKQTKNTLCNDDGYCCLGIAGKLCGVSDNQMSNNWEFRQPIKGLPKILVGSAASSSENKITHMLASLNDDHDKTFPEIADWIEENL